MKNKRVGQHVHYFPVKDLIAGHNNATVLPATIVQDWGNDSVNLSVQTMNPDAPVVLRWSISHQRSVAKQQVADTDNPNNLSVVPSQSYWREMDTQDTDAELLQP